MKNNRQRNRLALRAAVVLAALAPAARAAWFNTSGIGTAAGQFLTMGPGARAMALGEAYSTIADDGTSLYWNPATVALGPTRDAVTFMHAPYLADVTYDFAGYSRRVGANAGVGAALQYVSYGGLDRTDAAGVEQGTFHPEDLSLSLGAGYRFGEQSPAAGFAVGAAGKYVRSRLTGLAQTGTADVGLVSPLYAGQARFSLVAQNLGGRLNYGGQGQPLPTLFKAGGAFYLTPRWVAAADVQFPRANQAIAALGSEFTFFQGFDGAASVARRLSLSGRVGYNTRTLGEVSGMTGVSFGFGVTHSAVGSFDYALVPYGGLGLTHRISITLRFGGDAPRQMPTGASRGWPSGGAGAGSESPADYSVPPLGTAL